MSYGGMQHRLQSESYRESAEKVRFFAVRGALVAQGMLTAKLPEIMQRQLDLALGDDPKIAAQAGQFLLSRVMPSVSITENRTSPVEGAQRSALLERFTELVDAVRSTLPKTIDVTASRHILSGEAAKPRVIELRSSEVAP